MPDDFDYSQERQLALMENRIREHQYGKNFSRLPPRERLEELFIYDGNSGALIRRVSVGSRGAAGTILGLGSGKNGYTVVQVDGVQFWMHRIIWALAHGEDPGMNLIDHIDGNKRNNRISNLRLVSQLVNGQNRHRANKNNRSTGVLGVYQTKSGKFSAKIKVRRKSFSVGTFDSIDEAQAAYLTAKQKVLEQAMLGNGVV